MDNSLKVVIPGDIIPISNNNENTTIILGPGLRQDVDHIYIASSGESVLGTIISRLGEYYKVDIGTARPAILSVTAFEGATKRNKPNLALRTLVYCRVSMANQDMESELECVNPTTSKADGFGELKGGFVFKCSLGLCRRLLDPSTPILSLIGDHFPYEIAVGMNGRIWINSENVKHTIIIANAIQNSEYLSKSECEAMVQSLVD
ncbi:unnamed protein product [Cunninghamella echinulata]